MEARPVETCMFVPLRIHLYIHFRKLREKNIICNYNLIVLHFIFHCTKDLVCLEAGVAEAFIHPRFVCGVHQ